MVVKIAEGTGRTRAFEGNPNDGADQQGGHVSIADANVRLSIRVEHFICVATVHADRHQ